MKYIQNSLTLRFMPQEIQIFHLPTRLLVREIISR
jgi:hypothetical protein